MSINFISNLNDINIDKTLKFQSNLCKRKVLNDCNYGLKEKNLFEREKKSHICIYIFIYTFLPRDCKQITTELRFCLSQRSTVWKVSWAGTPNVLAASRNALMFSIHLNAKLVLLTFFTDPSLISFTNLKKKKNND